MSETQSENQSETQLEKKPEYSVTESGIAEMAERLAMTKIESGERLPITKVESKEDRDQAALGAKECVDLRMKIEEKRKELKAGAVAWGKKVDSAAKHFTGLISDIEKPLKQLRVAWDDKIKAEREAKKEVERQRVAAIDQAIADIRKMGNNGALLETADAVQEQFALLYEFEITEEMFQEKVVEAEGVKTEMLDVLKQLSDRRIAERAEADRLEKQRVEQAAEAKRLNAQRDTQDASDKKRRDEQAAEDEQRRKDQAAQQKKIDDQQAEMDRKQAEIDAEAKRLQDAKDEAERVEREAKEAKERAAQAEIDRKAAAERAEALKPDKEKVLKFVSDLRHVKLPKLQDTDLTNSVGLCVLELDGVIDKIEGWGR